MTQGYTAHTSVAIHAPIEKVWSALTDPKLTKEYIGANINTDWQEGGDISWQGEHKGKKFEDKGKVLHVEEERLLQYTHYSPMSGKPDTPENYHTVTVKLRQGGEKTKLQLSQDGNETKEEKDHAEKNWEAMLQNLKQMLEA